MNKELKNWGENKVIAKVKKAFKNYKSKMYNERKKSSVLIPLIQIEDEWHLLYEVRSEEVSQAGDSSFPGGRMEAGETFEETAVRETMEELNLKREHIKVHGEMDFIISQHIIIHSFVGELVDVDVKDIQPNIEVAEIYTVPINELLENSPKYFSVTYNPTLEDKFIEKQEENEYIFDNHSEEIPYYDVGTHSLWGFTANLTERFIEILRKETKGDH